MRGKLAAGNWKMNGVAASLAEVESLVLSMGRPTCEVLLCPPATLIHRMSVVASGNIKIGGQDCHAKTTGAHTGDLSAAMLADAGASYVIVGHSERRQDHGETDAVVQSKASAAITEGLVAVICVGETLEDREAERTLDVIAAQLDGSVPDTATAATVVVAYEPVWAIGSGLTPTLEQIGEVHDFIRTNLNARLGTTEGDAIRLLYGGSVKPGNAAEIFAVSNVDGALVGGASLKAADFGPIVDALSNA
ncbi:triose-phosphate isomerase [Pseudoruegeria sp. SK021]|uniref:triose-phosphate isomerase n=1 Tax=Pseudoruegeria sp. SK021 TaxID=1933035 RepID=UPI000A24F4BE|nr:triose-phosphate isomerase [Pseudoruegeria sp. SK021]OSP56144.1 triose-phosphate isomerase [Pseudoruegeria sp. SK021]